MPDPKSGADGAASGNPRDLPGTEISAAPENEDGGIVNEGREVQMSHETHVSQTQWNAPLPPPDDFNKYPDSVQNRIVTLAEQESEDRRAVRRDIVRAQIAHNKAAQNRAFIVLLCVIAVSAALVWLGHPYGLLLTLAGIIPVMDSLLDKLKELFSSGGKGNGDEHSD